MFAFLHRRAIVHPVRREANIQTTRLRYRSRNTHPTGRGPYQEGVSALEKRLVALEAGYTDGMFVLEERAFVLETGVCYCYEGRRVRSRRPVLAKEKPTFVFKRVTFFEVT